MANCQKLGDDRHYWKYSQKLEVYKTELFKDKALWDRVSSFEKGTCDRLKALKPEALQSQQQILDRSRGFER